MIVGIAHSVLADKFFVVCPGTNELANDYSKTGYNTRKEAEDIIFSKGDTYISVYEVEFVK